MNIFEIVKFGFVILGYFCLRRGTSSWTLNLLTSIIVACMQKHLRFILNWWHKPLLLSFFAFPLPYRFNLFNILWWEILPTPLSKKIIPNYLWLWLIRHIAFCSVIINCCLIIHFSSCTMRAHIWSSWCEGI